MFEVSFDLYIDLRYKQKMKYMVQEAFRRTWQNPDTGHIDHKANLQFTQPTTAALEPHLC